MTKPESSGANPEGAAGEAPGGGKDGISSHVLAAPLDVAADKPGAASASEIDEARTALKSLLARFGITSAVIIDDEAYDIAFSDVFALVSIHTQAAREALGAVGAELNFESPDLWRDPLEQEWNRLPHGEQQALYSRLATLGGEVSRTHARFASNIRDLLPVSCTVLQPKEWANREDEFVKKTIVEKDGVKSCSTLLLFDLDLEKAGLGKTGGATLILDVIAKHKGVDILCGIVSSLVRADDEGATLLDAPDGFDHERVVRIAKADLPEKPNQFVYGVKRALLAPHVIRLRETAAKIIADAHAAATARFKHLEIYDVVYAVITRSDEEGVRDFETFFRIHDVFYKDELRRQAYSTGELTKAASELRDVSLLAPTASKPTDRKTWELQRREIYDDARDLNRLHLPVELGDVFACDGRDGPATEYIVLGQPCDLIVRTRNGKRRADHVLVARISRTAPAKADGESLASFRLPYYLEGGDDAWVKFSDHYTVPAWVLDLCVYNDDGRAKYRDDAAMVHGLTAGWVKRAALLKTDVDRAVKRLASEKIAQPKGQAAAEPPLNALVERALAHPFVLAFARLAPLALEVRCQRVQRVLPPYSADMLTKFGHYLSRTAFEVDLGHGTLE